MNVIHFDGEEPIFLGLDSEWESTPQILTNCKELGHKQTITKVTDNYFMIECRRCNYIYESVQ